MLRVLENSAPQIIYEILIALLMRHRRSNPQAKILQLTVRCIIRVTKNVEAILPQLNVSEILLAAHRYMCEFFPDGANNTFDDLGVKTFRTIIKELVVAVKDDIWVYYEAVANHP
jgi:hypothetical protein